MAELTGKTIAELPELTSLLGADLIPVMHNASSSHVQYGTIRSQFSRVDGGTEVTEQTNIDEMTTPGTYVVITLANITGGTPPPTQLPYKLIVDKAFTYQTTPRLWQVAKVMAPSCIEYRRNYNSNGWSDWIRLDIGSINDAIETLGGGAIGMSRVSIPNAGQADIPLENSQHGVLFFTSIGTNANGAYTVFCNSSGVVSFKEISAGSSLTLTGGSNTLTVANASAYYTYALLLLF